MMKTAITLITPLLYRPPWWMRACQGDRTRRTPKLCKPCWEAYPKNEEEDYIERKRGEICCNNNCSAAILVPGQSRPRGTASLNMIHCRTWSSGQNGFEVTRCIRENNSLSFRNPRCPISTALELGKLFSFPHLTFSLCGVTIIAICYILGSHTSSPALF